MLPLSKYPLWLRSLIAFLGGASLTLSFAPYGLWIFGLVSLTLLASALTSSNPRASFLIAWSYGIGSYLTGASWVYVSIHVYGYAPLPLAAALTLLFCIAMGLFIALPFGLYSRYFAMTGQQFLLGFSATWLLTEWLRGWLFTGFPWLFVGHAHTDSLLSPLLPVIGSAGISAVMAFTAALLSTFTSGTRPQQSQQTAKRAAPVIVIVLIWSTGPLLKNHSWVDIPDAPPLKVGAIQANIPQEEKWNPANLHQTLQSYTALSEPLWDQHDLIVWPEAAIPGFYHNFQPFINALNSKASVNNSALLTGIPFHTEAGLSHNSVVLLNGTGNGSEQIYFKQRLVPFGEYVPLQNLLNGLLTLFELPLSDFRPGPSQQDNLHIGDWQIAPAICYEITYDQLIAQSALNANAIITVSNDAWFGDSIGPKQHMQIARIRALENAKPIIRSTGSGITGLIDHKGRVTEQVPSFSREVLSGELVMTEGATPFAKMKGIPVVVFIVIGLVFSYRKSKAK